MHDARRVLVCPHRIWYESRQQSREGRVDAAEDRLETGTKGYFRFGLLLLVGLFSVTIAACGGGGGSGGRSGPAAKPVACSSLTTLRDLAPELTYFTNPRTGDSVDYLVIGDAAVSDDLIVMFNGTGGILPDWPIQMITNSAASPQIVSTPAYSAAEDGTISICHDYRLVMFDYPGVGENPLTGNVTFDDISNDVDAMLNEIGRRYRIPTDRIDPLGWSLGTEGALKYAFVSPTSNPERKIGNLILIASKPGGNTDGFFDGNESSCVMTLFDEIKNNPGLDPSFVNELDTLLFELTFPYIGQTPNDGVDSGCTATITDNDSVTLSVTPSCPLDSECDKNFAVEDTNRRTEPWSNTGGVDYNLFVQQRETATDYSLCYCDTPEAGFISGGCSCSGDAPQMSSSNGGVCQTVSTGVTTVNAPISTNCVPFNISGKINVINGPEDLFIQYTYGQELVSAYQEMFGANAATIATYPGSDGAGHGVLMQHPMWTQQQIYNAINQ